MGIEGGIPGTITYQQNKKKKEKQNKEKNKKEKLKVEIKSINKTDYNVATESGKKAYDKAVEESKKPKRLSKKERAKHEEIAKKERQKMLKEKANKEGNEKAKGATTTGGPVKDGVEYARSKGDELAGFRRKKDTRITKHLKKSGWTEDRLAAKRKAHAEWKANRKKKKNKNKLKKNTMGG